MLFALMPRQLTCAHHVGSDARYDVVTEIKLGVMVRVTGEAECDGLDLDYSPEIFVCTSIFSVISACLIVI